jgi:hypothetical protein
MRSILNILLAVLLVLPILAGGIWWWSIQPGQLPLTEQQQKTLTLPQGVQLQLNSDPELMNTEIQWRWSVGTAADPDDLLGRHQLFLQGLLSGQWTAEMPSLAARMAHDPLGDFSLHLDREHTVVRLQASYGATAATVSHLAQLLSQSDWPPEVWLLLREYLTEIDPAYAFMSRSEAQHIDRMRPAVRPLIQPPSLWFELEPEALSRIMARYVEDFFNPSNMTLSVSSPIAMPELERLVQTYFTDVLDVSPSSYGESRRVNQPWTVRGAMSSGLAANNERDTDLRLMFPWSVSASMQRDIDSALAWLNSPLAQAPRQQLQAAGLLREFTARATDEMLIMEIEFEDPDAANPSAVQASIQQLLAALFTQTQQDQLRFNTHSYWVHDFRPNATLETVELSMPDPAHAIEISVMPAPVPLAEVSSPRASQHDLMGRQPRLLQADASWRVWHLPDQHFGTRLTHLSVHWPHPMGEDPLLHAQWQRWFERFGPGLTGAVWQAQQKVFSGAQGFRVEVDATGIHWHLTQDWPTLEQWLPQWLEQMQQLDSKVQQPANPDARLHQLLRERAQLSTPPELTAQPIGPIQLLLAGRVDEAELSRLMSQLEITALPAEAQPSLGWRLAEGHQLAELTAPNGVSRVSTWVELPQADHRHRTLAAASLPWLRATLEQQLLARDIAAQLSVHLTAPAGRLGLEVVLDSQSIDPARLNLQLTALWQDLNTASENRSAEALQEALKWRAERYREPPPSLAAASQFYWADIVAQRLHFNGRMRSARTLESTNLDGWTFFIQQWLFANTARRLTVNEVGANWADIYQELRRPPPDARPW